MKKVKYIIILQFLTLCANAQQLPIYSQYLYNRFLINPAVAGSDGYTSFNLTAREQWVGLYGAPQTFSFSGQTRIMKRPSNIRQTRSRRQVYRPPGDGKVGVGGFVFSDRNGLIQRTGFQAAYSYHLWLRDNTQISMGLAFTGYHFKINEKAIDFEDQDDPVLYGDLRKGIFVPDAAFGVYLLNARYSVGFSADQLFKASLSLGSDAYGSFRMSRHYTLFGTYSFVPNAYVEFQPSLLVRMSEQFRPQADIGLTYIYNQTFWAGLAFRTSGAAIANLGVKYENLWLGYAFDFTFQELQRVTYGTHELTLALKFGDSARRYRWLDRY